MLRFAKNIRYGHLVTVENTGKKTIKNAQIWLYRCDCGNETEKEARVVKAGRTQSCGKCYLSGQMKGIKKEKKEPHKRAIMRLGDVLKNKASEAGLEYSISPELLESITKRDCVLCGAKPNHHVTGFKHAINRPGRMRSTRGFVEENVQPVCKECHELLGKRSIDLLLEHHYRIHRHIVKK